MTLPRLIIVLTICILTVSCRKVSIIGHWKQVELDSYGYDSMTNFTYERILTILADSSFILDDGTTADTAGVPGSHAGGKFTGTWRMPDKKRLELTLNPEKSLLVLQYEIIKLTEKELVIIFPGWKVTPETQPLRYTRL